MNWTAHSVHPGVRLVQEPAVALGNTDSSSFNLTSIHLRFVFECPRYHIRCHLPLHLLRKLYRPQPVTMPQTLPPEILDRIIDYIHQEPQSLDACSLANRVLLMSSRSHQFQHLSLSFPVGLARVSELLRLLRRPTNNIAPYVKSVTLADVLTRSAAWNLLSLCDLLPHVQSLEVKGTGMHTILELRIFERIKHLRITQASFPSANSIINLICSFPELESVDMAGVTWSEGRNDVVPSSMVPKRPLTFVILELNGCVIRGLVNWLLSLDHIPTVRCIHGYTHRQSDTSSLVHRFYETVGASVQRLKVELFGLYDHFCDRGKHPIIIC